MYRHVLFFVLRICAKTCLMKMAIVIIPYLNERRYSSKRLKMQGVFNILEIFFYKNRLKERR